MTETTKNILEALLITISAFVGAAFAFVLITLIVTTVGFPIVVGVTAIAAGAFFYRVMHRKVVDHGRAWIK